MFRLLKGIFYLAVLGLLALVGFAYLGDLGPETGEQRSTVVLHAE